MQQFDLLIKLKTTTVNEHAQERFWTDAWMEQLYVEDTLNYTCIQYAKKQQ